MAMPAHGTFYCPHCGTLLASEENDRCDACGGLVDQLTLRERFDRVQAGDTASSIASHRARAWNSFIRECESGTAAGQGDPELLQEAREKLSYWEGRVHAPEAETEDARAPDFGESEPGAPARGKESKRGRRRHEADVPKHPAGATTGREVAGVFWLLSTAFLVCCALAWCSEIRGMLVAEINRIDARAVDRYDLLWQRAAVTGCYLLPVVFAALVGGMLSRKVGGTKLWQWIILFGIAITWYELGSGPLGWTPIREMLAPLAWLKRVFL